MSRRGHPAFLKPFRNSSPPQLECKEPCFVYCILPGWLAGWLAACRAANKRALGPWLLTTDEVWLAGCCWLPCICVASPDVRPSCFLPALPGSREVSRQGWSRGLHRTVFASASMAAWLQGRGHGWASQDSRRAGRDLPARSQPSSLLRRMCALPSRLKIDSSQCIDRPQSRQRGSRPPQYGTAIDCPQAWR